MEPGDEFLCLHAILSFPYHLDIWHFFQRSADALARRRMIVGQHDLNSHIPSLVQSSFSDT
jgi:hypothetical protein